MRDIEVIRIGLIGGADPGRTPGSAADPWSAVLLVKNPPLLAHPSRMTLYRRRLPHIDETEQSIFLTWRLHLSLPSNRAFPKDALHSGQALVALDRLRDEACGGPFYLRQPALADRIVEALHDHADILGHYLLQAFGVMPNPVHLPYAGAAIAPIDEIVERHHGQESQRDVELDRKTILAGREL